MKHCRSVVLLWGLVFGNALLQAHAVLRISFVEDLCYNTKLSVIDLKYDSTGILMSAPSINMKGSFECEVNLVPPKGSSVVLSIFKYDLYGGDELIIEDSDRHRIALMGYGLFKDEKKSIVSDGRMFIRYKTDNSTIEHRRAGFQFTFTKVMNSPCSSNEFKCNNGKCVLKELICDGHNHCGDRSDQMRCGLDESSKTVPDAPTNRSAIFLSLIIVAAVVLLIVIIIFIVCIVKGTKLKKAIAKKPSPVPLQSVSSNVPRQASHAPVQSSVPRQNSHVPVQSSVAPRQDITVHCSVPHQASANVAPENSFYHRVRRSFRGASRAPEHVPSELRVESYQVPSMYPSLDMDPNTPEMYGVDNGDFRIEE